MKMPIIIDENGDLSFYSSTETAEKSLEPIDVKNSEYIGYDGEGRLLNLYINKKDSSSFFDLFKNEYEYVKISVVDDEPSHRQQLSISLVDFLRRLGVSNELVNSGSLSTLIEEAIKIVGVEE